MPAYKALCLVPVEFTFDAPGADDAAKMARKLADKCVVSVDHPPSILVYTKLIKDTYVPEAVA